MLEAGLLKWVSQGSVWRVGSARGQATAACLLRPSLGFVSLSSKSGSQSLPTLIHPTPPPPRWNKCHRICRGHPHPPPTSTLTASLPASCSHETHKQKSMYLGFHGSVWFSKGGMFLCFSHSAVRGEFPLRSTAVALSCVVIVLHCTYLLNK